MQIRKILCVILLCAFATSKVMTDTIHLFCVHRDTPTQEQQENAKVGVRRKYSDRHSLNHYGISYPQLNTIIEKASRELLEQRANCNCQSFEQVLEAKVVNVLQAKAKQHHTVQGLSSADVREKIQKHELKLEQQYCKPDQLKFYKVNERQVVNAIKETSDSLFGRGDKSMVTTEAQLAELFRMHTDAFLAKLQEHRNR